MFIRSIRGSARPYRSIAWSSLAVLVVLLAGPAARAQFDFDPADLDPFNRNSAIRKEAEKLDPTVALRRELEDARKAAMKNLRKFDPQEIFRRVQGAVEKRISKELRKSGVKYDKASGEADLRGTEMGKVLTHWLRNFAQGNKGTGRVEELSFNVKTKRLAVRLMAKHCQSWGKVIPGQGEVELYSVTQRATFRYDFHKGSGSFDIDLGPLAPHINSRTLEKMKEGDLIGIAEGLVPEAAGKLWNHESKNEYTQRVTQYRQRYGAANVYFASKKFVDWAGPDTIGKYILNGVVTGGTSVYPQIMRDLNARAREELPALTAWLKQRGMANADSAARQLLTGHAPRWPYIKFEMIPVRYSSREKPLHAVTTPWRNVDHLAFVIVWTNPEQSPGAKKGSSTRANETPAHPEKRKAATKTIRVRFTNRTPHGIAIHLNGGKQVNASLPAGQERSFQIPINAGKAPTVSFAQRKGRSLSLPVHDGGSYTFRVVRGEVRLVGR